MSPEQFMRLVTAQTQSHIQTKSDRYKYDHRPSVFKDYLPYHEVVHNMLQLFVFTTVLHGSNSNVALELIIKQQYNIIIQFL